VVVEGAAWQCVMAVGRELKRFGRKRICTWAWKYIVSKISTTVLFVNYLYQQQFSNKTIGNILGTYQ
jgi:hypothetical protein